MTFMFLFISLQVFIETKYISTQMFSLLQPRTFMALTLSLSGRKRKLHASLRAKCITIKISADNFKVYLFME